MELIYPIFIIQHATNINILLKQSILFIIFITKLLTYKIISYIYDY